MTVFVNHDLLLYSERHYVAVSRIVTTISMLLGAGFMFFLANSRESFNLLLSIGAGTGLLYLLRWFWWRINAWSEIAAMMSSFVVSLGLFALQKSGFPIDSHVALLINVTLTTLIWITVTFLTRPTDEAVLVNFYKLVRPMGRGWRALRNKYQLSPSPDSLPHAFLAWMLGCVAVYAALFCMGYIFYGQTFLALFSAFLFVSSAGTLVWLMNLMERSRGQSNEL